MKILNFRLLFFAALFAITFNSCKHESENIFNMFDDVKVTYHGDHPFSVTDYKEVNDGDSVYIDYTITSAKKDMYRVDIHEAGVNTSGTRINIGNSERRSYSGVLKLKVDKKVGKTTYRVYALDKDGVFIGDGYKSVTINVLPNYTHLPNRRLYLPDTTAKVLPSYYSISTGKTYSYTTGKDFSSSIDFGVYRRQVTTGTTTSYIYNIYSLSATPLPLTVYNIADWAKRNTLFSQPTNNNQTSAFNNVLTGQQLVTEAKKRTINLTQTTNGFILGSIVSFLTPEGKYGVFLVNAITQDSFGNPILDISVKVEK
jgi:hypothetical protein